MLSIPAASAIPARCSPPASRASRRGPWRTAPTPSRLRAWRSASSAGRIVPLLDKLRAIVGPAHVLAGIELSPYVIEGRTPEAAVRPGSVDEVAAVIAQAAEAGVPVVPWGGGSAVGVGVPPARAGLVLLLTRLSALVEHEPGDLTATAQAGVTVAALQAALRARGQWLSLDPPDAARATLGGGFAGVGEQGDWQVAALAGVVAPCGGAKPAPLPPALWERLAAAARDAFDAPAAMMTLSVLPGVVADTMEQGAEAARQR